MSEDILRYDLLIESALRDVVRKTVEAVARDGLPGDHHFYITFLTRFPGVQIPDYLRQQYPEEMTIVLQFQFFGLKIENDSICVTLSFNNIKENLIVPIGAVTTFADPSVNFALQFQNSLDLHHDDEGAPEQGAEPSSEAKDGEKTQEEKRGEVISLDKFRKK